MGKNPILDKLVEDDFLEEVRKDKIEGELRLGKDPEAASKAAQRFINIIKMNKRLADEEDHWVPT